MVRIVTLIGLVVALAAPQAAFARDFDRLRHAKARIVRGTAHPLSTFQRGWNNGHESQNRARASARWVRRHGVGFPSPF